MLKKFSLIAFTVVALAVASAPRASAGVEMVEPEYAPAPRYTYTPPPPPVVYYAPPPRVVIVEPAFAYYAPRYRHGYHRRFYGGHRPWRGYGHHHRR